MRPGNLTGRQFVADAQRAEAARPASANDVEAIRKQAYRAGWDAGHDAGWSAAITFVMESYDVFEKEDESDED